MEFGSARMPLKKIVYRKENYGLPQNSRWLRKPKEIKVGSPYSIVASNTMEHFTKRSECACSSDGSFWHFSLPPSHYPLPSARGLFGTTNHPKPQPRSNEPTFLQTTALSKVGCMKFNLYRRSTCSGIINCNACHNCRSFVSFNEANRINPLELIPRADDFGISNFSSELEMGTCHK